MHVLRTFAVAAALMPAFLTPALAHEPDGATFAAAFREACVPQRMSYEGILGLAGSLGWKPVVPGSSQELSAIFGLADAALAEEGDADWSFDRSAFDRIVAGKLHHLVVTRVQAPGVAPVVSCALYDLGATGGIDPAPVAGLVGAPEERYFVNSGLHAHSWGETPALPGTFQTVLTFVAEDSPHVEKTGFSGLVLKIDSTEPGADAAGTAATD
ncbi:hypothetical protein [Oricola thermophila]|uniref:Uncharacterized protein n=1 Tax=Oricola thermophila TaxID=2742145 RepID=A0A6N1VKM0_9HYPH|nr:hypothetical protein [Oricola thermophila]QKV19952.1 hypothetical protein HTY61_16580 [Oricola thermophila]